MHRPGDRPDARLGIAGEGQPNPTRRSLSSSSGGWARRAVERGGAAAASERGRHFGTPLSTDRRNQPLLRHGKIRAGASFDALALLSGVRVSA